MRTQPHKITSRLLQGYDPEYYNSAWRQMNYAFGEPWNNAQPLTDSKGDLPDFEDIVVRYQEVGSSRRILNNQFIGLSRIMYSDPEPEFPQVDQYTAELRKQAYLTRYREGEWADECASCFMDFDGLGTGFIQLGMKTNPKTGFQQVHAAHSPLVLTLWDRHERNPGRARWIAFVKHVPLDIAEDIWGAKRIRKGNHIRRLKDGRSSNTLECVRVIEYYDLGCGLKGDPTMAVVPSNLSNEPWEVHENAFGTLPFAYVIHFLAPGMRRAVGRIALQMSTQEALNELERSLRNTLKQEGFMIIDLDRLDPSDVEELDKKQPVVKLRLRNPFSGEPPIIRVPAAEAARTLIDLRSMYVDQFSADSGVTELDRGTQLASQRTLGEVNLVAQRGSVQSSWSELQATKMQIRVCEKACQLMELFDRDPMTLDFFGMNVMVNDPADPRSWLNEIMAEPSKVVIGPESLRTQDVKRDRAEKLALLQALQGDPNINPAWLAEEKLKAIGEKDPKAAMASPVGPMQERMGMPPL